MNKFNNGPIEVLALKDTNMVSLKESSSGGAFAVLARAVLEQHGIVFGCLWDADGQAVHGGIEDLEDLELLQGSKYVQSNTSGVYKHVRMELNRGRKVLFSGTPCEVAALYKYLETTKLDGFERNLLTCDLICHGVTSPKLFKAYKEWIQKSNKATSPIKSYMFRSKRYGWGPLYYEYIFERKGRMVTKGGISDDDPYYSAFLKGDLYRDCCYTCPFASLDRPGDYTIGDFWGIESQHPDFDTSEGVSALLINSERGQEFFKDHCQCWCTWIESTEEAVSAHNSNLKAPSKMSSQGPRLRLEVQTALESHQYDELFGRILKPSTGIKGLVRRVLPFPVVKKMSEVLHGMH